MQPEQFTYPSYSEPLAEAYGGRFESVFIALHPFVRVPEALAWSATKCYPDDTQIRAVGAKYTWQQVAEQTGLRTCARVNQALLTSIGSVEGHLADPAGRNQLQQLLEAKPVWMPVEGRFEPLLQPDFLEVFTAADAEELVFISEFPNSDPVVRLPIADMKNGFKNNIVPFPTRGTLLAPDASFLFTVDWDSFFTLFYGPTLLLPALQRS